MKERRPDRKKQSNKKRKEDTKTLHNINQPTRTLYCFASIILYHVPDVTCQSDTQRSLFIAKKHTTTLSKNSHREAVKWPHLKQCIGIVWRYVNNACRSLCLSATSFMNSFLMDCFLDLFTFCFIDALMNACKIYRCACVNVSCFISFSFDCLIDESSD